MVQTGKVSWKMVMSTTGTGEMLTTQEIKEKAVESKNANKLFAFDIDVYMNYLPYEYVKEFLKEGVTEEEWNKALKEDGHELPATHESVVADMKSYMEFAIGKALDHRGISANRSVQKMEAWTHIIRLYDEIDWDNYANYGAPILRQICDKMGWQEMYQDKADFIRMSEGKKCTPDCNEGCGMGWS